MKTKDMHKIVERMIQEKCLPKRVIDTRPMKPSMPSCDICESVEDLYEPNESTALVRLIPQLGPLRKSQASGRICRGCITRLVKLSFRLKKQTITYEDLVKLLHDQGLRATFDQIIETAMHMGIRVHLKVRKMEYNRMFRRMNYREARFRASWDARNLRYETFEKMAQQRKKEPPDKPTMTEFLKLHNAVKEGKPINTHPERPLPKVLTLKTFTRLLFKKPFDIIDYPIADSNIGLEHERRAKQPCVFCREVICDPKCPQIALYRFNRAFYGFDNVYIRRS